MRFFDQKFSFIILCIALPLLFLPKINLFSIDSAETAGLRIDDIILFFLGGLLLWAHAFSQQSLFKVEGWILWITAFSFFSFLMNRLFVSMDLLHMDAKIFYVIRLLEYFIFFYVGVIASRFFEGIVLMRIFLVFNLIFMTLQKFNLAGGILSRGYQADVSGRVQGIASFPSEMGLLLNLLFCYMVFDDSNSLRLRNLFRSPSIRLFLQKLYPYAMFCLFSIFVIWTGNRISILALIICFLFRIKQDFSWKSVGSWFLLCLATSLVAAGGAILIFQTAGVYERSFALFSWKNIELFEIVWDKINIAIPPIGNEVVSSTNTDMSWWLRIHKWLFAIKSFLLNPECYLTGLGPGYCGAALDGGILRIIVEYGLIGTLLFWQFFASLYQLNIQTKWMMIAFALNMIFFDAYLAYKTMSLLLFACGMVWGLVREKEPSGA